MSLKMGVSPSDVVILSYEFKLLSTVTYMTDGGNCINVYFYPLIERLTNGYGIGFSKFSSNSS